MGGDYIPSSGSGKKNKSKRSSKTKPKNEADLSMDYEMDDSLLKPLWIATTIANYPCAVFWATFSLVVLLTFLDSLSFVYQDWSERTWLIDDASYTQDFDAYTLAREESDKYGSGINEDESGSDLPQTEEQGGWTVYMLFKMLDYDKHSNNTFIFTPDNLETIIKYENKVLDDPKWNQYYCYVGTDTDYYECDYYSLAQIVYDHFGRNFSNMTEQSVRRYVLDLHSTESYQAIVEASFNPEFAKNEDHSPTYIYRSFLTAGNPIPDNITTVRKLVTIDANTSFYDNLTIKSSKYENGDSDIDKQETEYEDDWALDFFTDITVKHQADLKEGNLKIATLIWVAYDAYVWQLIGVAFIFIGCAMVAVLIWMTIHLQSIFLSCLAVIGIMLSFPFAYFIYDYVFDVGYFDVISTLIIFVLLGVGADDVFVFTDAWHQSVHFVKNSDDKVQRMTFTYRRASKAMFVTQVTTFFAFIATAFSRLMVISAFGIWAATIVLCNFLLVITMYPSVLMMHHLYIKNFEEKYICCCCHWSKHYGEKSKISRKLNTVAAASEHEHDNDEPISPSNDNKTSNNTNSEAAMVQMTSSSAVGGNSTDPNTETTEVPRQLSRQLSVEETAAQYRRVEQFFGLKWAQLIMKIKYYVLIFFAILFGVSCYLAFQVEALDEDESWFSNDHYMQKIVDWMNEFSVSEEDDIVDAYLVWGVKGVNRKGTTIWDPEDYGKVVWDDSFDMSSYDAQLFLYQACLNLSESDTLVYQKSSVICPLSAFKNYTQRIGEQFPWTYEDPDSVDFDDSVQKSQFAEKMYNFTFSNEAYSVMFENLLYVREYDSTDGGNTYEVKYYSLYTQVPLSWGSLASDGRKLRSKWKKYVKSEYYNNEDCPDSVCEPIEASAMWTWLVSQAEFVISAMQGIGIALPVAFVVLLLSTQNWIVAIFATLNIIGIMACALAVVSLNGWKFGISESISIVVIIGFSVDYVVHLANAYLESTAENREERLGFSLLTMGVSVASGAVTTFLSGFFMIFPEFQFYFKMGVIILATIIGSILWAMFFFTSLLAAFGPEGDTGNIPFGKLIEPCKKSWQSRK